MYKIPPGGGRGDYSQPKVYVFINIMAINFEVLHTCMGRVAMATIYVVIMGITVYEYPQFGKHVFVQTCKVMQCPMSS